MGWKERNRPPDTISNHSRIGSPWFGYRWGRGSWLRRPKTTQERRMWDAEFGRKKRSPQRLPEAWDDFWIDYQRSWKRHRKTQYRRITHA